MDRVDLALGQAKCCGKLVEILRLLLRVEVNPHDGHGVNLLFQTTWSLTGEALYINGRIEFVLHKTLFFGAQVAKARDQFLALSFVEFAVGFGGLHHGADHEACDRFLIGGGLDRLGRVAVELRVKHIAEAALVGLLACLHLLGQTAQKPAKATIAPAQLAQDIVETARGLLGLLCLLTARKAFEKAANAARLTSAGLLLLTATKDIIHHVFKPAQVRFLACIRGMLATEQAVSVLLSCLLLTRFLGHGRDAFGDGYANGDFGECFHK